jgi:hypothetical protein
MSLLRDEQRNYSTSRVLLLIWTTVIIGVIIWKDATVSQALLTFFSSIYLFLATWAAGPRMVQYLAPQISAMVNSVSQSKNVDVSSDIEELVEKSKQNKG